MATSNDTTLKKTCTKCGVEYPATAEYFNRSSEGKNGLRAICRKCTRAAHSLYNAANRDKQAAYRAANREKLRIYAAVYRLEHPEYTRAYNIAHREKKRIYNAEHREKRRACTATYQHSPRGKEKGRIYSHNRRAFKRTTGDNITPAEYDAVLVAHTNTKGQIICAWCGEPIKDAWHFDHWIPLSKGGKHEARNLRVMHGNTDEKCNLRKGAKLPFEFGKLI